MRILVIIALLFQAEILFAEQPVYCHPGYFLSHEAPIEQYGLHRAHQFQLARMTLVGIGVGLSLPGSVKYLSQRIGGATANQHYCTWYLNVLNPFAQYSFEHYYMPDPRNLTPAEAAETYMRSLSGAFFQNQVNFLGCLREYGYVALGCNSMRHRGPTVFGMLLAFSGCSPGFASEIANRVWGLNGVDPEVRLAAIKAAHEYGIANPEPSGQMRLLLSNSKTSY